MVLDSSVTPDVELGLDPDELAAAVSPDSPAPAPAPDDDPYRRLGLDQLSDEAFFDVVARVVSVAKQQPASSFILHAPLELLARRALLGYVSPERREAVRRRMLWVAATYERAGDPLLLSAPSGARGTSGREFSSVAEAADALARAIDAADLESVDRAAAWLAGHASTDEVCALAPAFADRLAAAGHGSIYFSLVARVAPRSRAALAMLRPLARELARQPQWRMAWLQRLDEDGGASADARNVAHALAATPRVGLPGSDFIYPIVHQVDDSGVAARVVGEALAPSAASDRTAAGNAIMRAAALSMLQDDPTYAPYGWTHCLTLPQAVLAIPGPPDGGADRRLAIAATYVVGFRAALGNGALDVDHPLPVDVHSHRRTVTDVVSALESAPIDAAAAVFGAPEATIPSVVQELAARAGAHEDAHLAKYTLACFDAASHDPEHARTYLAASAYLAAWWARGPGAEAQR